VFNSLKDTMTCINTCHFPIFIFIIIRFMEVGWQKPVFLFIPVSKCFPLSQRVKVVVMKEQDVNYHVECI